MTYKIEVVCAGNIARSPMAEVLGNGIVDARGLTGQLEIVSSGTMVSTPVDFPHTARLIGLAAKLPKQYRSAVSPEQHALEEEIVSGAEGLDRRYLSDDTYKTAVDTLRRKRREDLIEIGRTLRNGVLQEVGFYVDRDRVQTTARPDVGLVLGLDSRVAAAAEYIYREGGLSVPVTTLGEHLCLFPDIEDPVGITDITAYRNLRDFLGHAMIGVIEKFVND